MSDIGDRLEKILTGQDMTSAPRATLREKLAELRDHYGSGRKAAAAMGINESVFRRALSGQTKAPKPATAGAAEQVIRSLGARQISNADLKIPVTPKGGAGRARELKATNLRITDPGAAEKIRQAYVSGGKEAAAAVFLKLVGDQHYRSWLCPDSLRDAVGADEPGDDYGYNVA